MKNEYNQGRDMVCIKADLISSHYLAALMNDYNGPEFFGRSFEDVVKQDGCHIFLIAPHGTFNYW